MRRSILNSVETFAHEEIERLAIKNGKHRPVEFLSPRCHCLDDCHSMVCHRVYHYLKLEEIKHQLVMNNDQTTVSKQKESEG